MKRVSALNWDIRTNFNIKNLANKKPFFFFFFSDDQRNKSTKQLRKTNGGRNAKLSSKEDAQLLNIQEER